MNTTTSTVAVTQPLAALGLKVANAMRKTGAGRRPAVNDVASSFLSWVVSIGAVWLLARAVGDEITIGAESRRGLGLDRLIVFGLVFGSAAGTLYDFKATDSTMKQPILPGTPR